MISRVHSWLTSSCRWTHFSGRHVLDLLPGQPSFAPKVRITSDDCYLVGISCWWCCYFELIIKRSVYVRDSGIVRLLSPLVDQFHLKIFSMYKLIFSSFCCSTNPQAPFRPHSAHRFAPRGGDVFNWHSGYLFNFNHWLAVTRVLFKHITVVWFNFDSDRDIL